MAYKEVKLDKAGSKALYDAMVNANDATERLAKAAKAEARKQTPVKKPAPKKK